MPKRKITQDDVMAIRYVTDAALSPDGTQAVYVRADVTGKGEKEKQVLSIWQVATDGQGSPRRLTRGNSSAWAPAWSTDGNGIYFVSSRDKVPQVYYLPLDGGEAEAVTAFEFGVASFKVNPRRRELVVSASTKAPPTYGDDDHWRIGRSWYRFDPMPGVLLQDLEQALYVVRHSGGRPRELMRTQGMIVEGNISPDGNRVAIVVMGTAEHAFFDADLVLLATRGQPSATTVIRNRPLAGVTWAGNDSILLTSPRRDIADQSTLYVVDPGTGTMADRTSSMDLMVGTGVNGHSPVRLQSAMFAEDDGTVLTTVSRGGSVNVESISLKGRRQATALTEGQQVCHPGFSGSQFVATNGKDDDISRLSCFNRLSNQFAVR